MVDGFTIECVEDLSPEYVRSILGFRVVYQIFTLHRIPAHELMDVTVIMRKLPLDRAAVLNVHIHQLIRSI
jgi:hypothetical protein